MYRIIAFKGVGMVAPNWNDSRSLVTVWRKQHFPWQVLPANQLR